MTAVPAVLDQACRISRGKGAQAPGPPAAPAHVGEQVHATEADRDHAFAQVAQADQAAQLAQQEVNRARAAEGVARGKTAWVRANAENTLPSFRADAARDRDEIRADLRARNPVEIRVPGR